MPNGGHPQSRVLSVYKRLGIDPSRVLNGSLVLTQSSVSTGENFSLVFPKGLISEFIVSLGDSEYLTIRKLSEMDYLIKKYELPKFSDVNEFERFLVSGKNSNPGSLLDPNPTLKEPRDKWFNSIKVEESKLKYTFNVLGDLGVALAKTKHIDYGEDDARSVSCPMDDASTSTKDGFYDNEEFTITMTQDYKGKLRQFDCGFSASSNTAEVDVVVDIQSLAYSDKEQFNSLLRK